jgi:hypothetical protein
MALAALLLGSCAGTDMSDPRQVVISLFGAMEKNDKAALVRLLDLAELMKTSQEDYAFQTDNPRFFTNPEQVLDDLTGDGETKRTWFALQRIVNKAQVMGESATVEVTFVDKESSRGYRTTFGLHLKEGKWRIYTFKVFQDSS